MRTRCPRCDTIFRITPEQLRIRAGKVRCGYCQAVFNALESLIEEPPAPLASADEPPSLPPLREEELDADEALAEPILPLPPLLGSRRQAKDEAPPTEPQLRNETPAETTQTAREAGLVAARDLTETPGYSRWAAGTLADSPLAGLEPEPRPHAGWPFALASLLLCLVLAGQLAHHFRSQIAQRLPEARGIFTAFGADLPLPRQADLVSIEASDLQSDNTRRLLVLQATLKNRAPYAQAWPALELTLTDTQDTVVARRVLAPTDYLPPKTDAAAFAAHGETGLRLWIEAQEIAAGYRLYVFYP